MSKKFSLIEGMKDAIDAIMELFIYQIPTWHLLIARCRK